MLFALGLMSHRSKNQNKSNPEDLSCSMSESNEVHQKSERIQLLCPSARPIAGTKDIATNSPILYILMLQTYLLCISRSISSKYCVYQAYIMLLFVYYIFYICILLYIYISFHIIIYFRYKIYLGEQVTS